MISHILMEDMDYISGKLTDKELDSLKSSTILITGCAGFLGYYFINFFLYNAERLSIKKVICLDNFILGCPKWLDDIAKDKRVEVKKFDIIKDNIEKVRDSDNVDFVIHMASIASPIFYRKYPIETLDANVWGLRRLLNFYVDKNIKGFLFFSSSEIYGDPSSDAIPTNEEYRGFVSVTGPRACYDEAKRFGETMCMLFSQKYDMPIGVARPFNNYGPGMKLDDRRVPADFAKNIFENKDIVILSNGSPRRTFCYISDAIVGYLKILIYGKYDYFNIGIETPEITIKELADIYQRNGRKIFDYKGRIIYNQSEDKEYLTNNPQRRCPDITKARRILNYRPTIPVDTGVGRFLQFIKESTGEHYK